MSTISPSDFLETYVLPVIIEDPRAAFPEFDFRRVSGGWEAGKAADQRVLDYFGARHDRIMLSTRKPGLIVVAGSGETFQLVRYVLGVRSSPRGEDFKTAVRRLAELAGVDTAEIDGRPLSDEERARINAQHARRAKEAEEAREAEEERQRIADEEAKRKANNLIHRAMEQSRTLGDGLARAYFKRRGIDLALAPGAEFGKTLLAVEDAVTPGATQRALVVPMVREGAFVAAQRLFVDAHGRPVEVEVREGQPTRKAVVGRPVGAYALVEAVNTTGTLFIVEGYETGVSVGLATGCDVVCGISAHGIETVEIAPHLLERNQRVVVAGDLDRSETGQKAAAVAADRVRREYGLPAAVALPSHALVPSLVGEDGMPLEGKSVDWEDVYKAVGAEVTNMALGALSALATLELDTPPQEPEHEDGGVRGPQTPSVGFSGRPKTVYTEPGMVLPDHELDRAHMLLRDRFTLPGAEATSLAMLDGRIHLYRDGRWVQIGEPSVIRAEIRRWSLDAYIHKVKRVNDPDEPKGYRYDHRWEIANLGKTPINAILEAVCDEVRLTTPIDDFRTQFWIEPNVDGGEILCDTPTWARRIDDPGAAGLPDPAMVLSVDNGLLDLEAWRDRGEFVVLPHTPAFFSSSKLDVTLPEERIADAIVDASTDDPVSGLRALARSMCPEFVRFVHSTFADDQDPASALEHERELGKMIGYYLTEDLIYHQGNIFWLVGPPGVGKSTLINTIVALLGSRNTVSSNMHKITQQFHLSSWIGKRLAIFADLDQGARSDVRTNVEIFKLISTGDAVSLDRKHRDEIPSHVLSTRILCSVNQVPRLDDPTGALRRRSFAFDFKRVPKPEDRDEHLFEKLTTPESLAGILLLAICGIHDLKADGGFVQPEGSTEPLDTLAEQGSDYPEFIDLCVEVDNGWTMDGEDGKFAGAFTLTEDLHEAFCGYLDDMGTKWHPKRSQFIAELLPVLIEKKGWRKTSKYRQSTPGGGKGSPGYRGLRLTPYADRLLNEHRGGEDGGEDTPPTGFPLGSG